MVVMQLSDIHIAPYNPRVMPDDEYQKLLNNIKTNGYLEYIVVNKRTGYTIISGNHRYKALLELGWTEAEVIVTDVSLEQEKALNIAMNRISGVFDQEKLEELIIDLKEDDTFTDLELTGLSDFEFDMIFSDLENDPYSNEFKEEDKVYRSDNEKDRGSPRPKKSKKPFTCPHCGEEIEF